MSTFPRIAAGLLIVALSCAATAQVNNPAYRDYLLVGQFGEICPQCEAIVLCAAESPAPAGSTVPAAGTFTLYYLHTRTFWSQMATIWEWFITNFTTASLESGHRRPVTIYRVTAGAWAPAEDGEAHVQLDPARVGFTDGREIDRRDRRWHSSGGSADTLGSCQRLPLWDALAAIEDRAPAQASTRTGASP